MTGNSLLLSDEFQKEQENQCRLVKCLVAGKYPDKDCHSIQIQASASRYIKQFGKANINKRAEL
jgi:hypothetical protein